MKDDPYAIEIGSHKVYNPRLCKTVPDRQPEYHATDDDICILGIVVVIIAIIAMVWPLF